MRNVTVERTVASPRHSVWAVLADYPNIVDWNEAVKNSYAIGDAIEGVGAQRQVDLGSKGSIKNRETVTEWTPEQRMVIAVDKIEKQPIKQATMTFTLSDGDGTTPFTMSYDYEPKGGPLALIYGPILDRLLGNGFNAFIDDLGPAAQARTAD
ncbi:MAG: SRPBCC family protein [Actinomycetia bacterium]|nr:SRPBCC family protein [Actinomycetes bacterium]MCP5031970.1 SRPBCC family protein [Actinomycetes bacterium]